MTMGQLNKHKQDTVMASKSKKNPLLVYLSLAVVLLGLAVIFAIAMVIKNDRNNRKSILVQAKLLERSIGQDRLLHLSGTDADLELPDYLNLKEKLQAACLVIPHCRFIYLLGRNASDDIFFFVDSEPADSLDSSPAGQIYDEVSDSIKGIFFSGKTLVEGPYTDRWGTWISAFVPFFDPQGKVIAVLGMDINARTWKRILILQSLLPMILFVLIEIILSLFFYLHKKDRAEKILITQNRLALENSEKRYRGVFQNIQDGIMILKMPEAKFISVNPAALAMFGINEESKFLMLSPAEISPQYQPDGSLSQEKSAQMMEAAIAQGFLVFEWRHKRWDNQEFPAQVLLAKMEQAGEEMLLAVVRDLSEVKRIEEDNRKHLEELEVFYRVSMGREERIIELKKEVTMLRQALGQEKKL